jgi:hypothetical protein
VVLAVGSGRLLRAQVDRDVDLAAIRRASAHARGDLPAVEERWRATFHAADEDSFAELFGYNPPGRAIQLATLHAFLYAQEHRDEDALAAASDLLRMAAYRDEVPAALIVARVEYAEGLPAVPSFFQLADYAEAWARIRACPAIPAAQRAVIEAAIAGSAEFVFVFPEWGPHNRAMLRAECLLHAALAVPDHPRAAAWRAMAEILAEDSRGQWEIEDAQLYHPIWLLALLRYAHSSGDEETPRSLQVRYYLRYFLELLGPPGTAPDFGDAWWNASLDRFYACFEWGAAVLQDPELKWAARQVYAALPAADPALPDLRRALLFVLLAGHLDTELRPRAPVLESGPVLDDVIGKKVVLRRGTGERSRFLLLNYRDEGDWGLLARDYLRQTLAVEEEKMHHGNADENSIALFMDQGSLLLHDAGYREQAPSGPYGAFRADLFHNRLIARNGAPASGQDVLEFLRDAGAYRQVRTEKIDFVALGLGEYSRTRLTDDERGYRADRILLAPDGAAAIVVIDTVEVLRDGTYTFATLFAQQEILARGPGWALGRHTSIEGHTFPGDRQLLLVFPDRPDEEPPSFPLRRHRQPEHVLHQTTSGRFAEGARLHHVAVLWPLAPDADPAATAARVSRLPASPAPSAIAVELDLEPGRFRALLKADLQLGVKRAGDRPLYAAAAGTVSIEGCATDADLLFSREDGAELRWGAVDMTHVTVNGAEVFRARPQQFFQVNGRSNVVGTAKWRRWEGSTPR